MYFAITYFDRPGSALLRGEHLPETICATWKDKERKPTPVAHSEKVLCEYAQNRTLIGGSRLSFPGLGHMRQEGNGYVWLRLPYNSHPATAEG